MGQSTGSPWRGPALAAGGVLLTAFANRLPEQVQDFGLVAGLLLSGLGVLDIIVHWAREKELAGIWINRFKTWRDRGGITIVATRASEGAAWEAKVTAPRHYVIKQIFYAFAPGVLIAIFGFFTIDYVIPTCVICDS